MRMYRIVLMALSLIAGLHAQGYDKIGISFSRTGTNASSVTTTVVDQTGAPLEGVTAQVTSSHTFIDSGGSVTENMLCFNANGNSSPTITFSVALAGLKEAISFTEVGVNLHALNSAKNYQANNDGKARKWNIALSQNDRAFGNLSDFDAASGVGQTGSVHKFWTLSGSSVTASNTLTLTFTITAGTANMGCFLGLTDITIGGSSRIEPTGGQGPEPSAFGGEDKYYHIVWHNAPSSYLTESGSTLQVESQSTLSKQYWQFLPTANAGCYYIKNAVTKRYIEACKTSQNNTYHIRTTDKAVEYYISKEAAVGGAYRLTSTNCSNYGNTSKSPVGLNKDGASSYVITWGAGTNNTGSYWDITPTEFTYDYEGVEALKRHSDFAKSAQVYFMPCGTLNSTYTVKSLKLTGEGAMKELDYPCTTWSGNTSTVSTATASSWWTIYTTDKAHVALGKEVQAQVRLNAKPAAGYLVQACFDWDHDGEFEDVHTEKAPGTSLTFTTSVPANAPLGESRMRIRITDNGEEGPDTEVSQGQILDCILCTVPQQEPSISVTVNDPNRGDAYYNTTTETAIATPCGNALFLCWLEGKKVVSTQASYGVKADRPRHLTAVLSVNTTDKRPIGILQPVLGTDEPYATPLYFDLTGHQIDMPVKGQTYIRKDSPRKGQLIRL